VWLLLLITRLLSTAWQFLPLPATRMGIWRRSFQIARQRERQRSNQEMLFTARTLHEHFERTCAKQTRKGQALPRVK
jgi:hypothetical protein